MTEDVNILIESFKENHHSDDKIDSIVLALRYLSHLESVNEATTATESCARNYYTRCATNIIKESLEKENTFVWPYTVAPYFTPEESAELRDYYTTNKSSGNNGYYSESTHTFGDRSIFYDLQSLENDLRNTEDPEEIGRIKAEIDKLSAYSGEAQDFYTEATGTQFNPRSWTKKVTTLITQLKTEENPEMIDQIKQSLVDLGWNPEIEYTVENQIKAKKRIESIYQERYKDIITLDLTSLIESSNINTEVIEESSNDKVKPIHVVMVKGKSPFSDAISAVTNSQFSHAAICIDNDFNNLYSFNVANGNGGGFSNEKIDNYPKENRLAVFSFFVTKDNYDKIEERVKMLSDNVNKTAYSVINILALPFKRINLNLSNSMICSQFVDSLLKMANMDITGKDSSHVVPNDLYTAGKANGKIYKVFDGVTKDFNPKKVVAYMNRMAKKVKISHNESTILEEYFYPTLLEAKLPIQFNKDGDALLTNTFVDFDREYSASHKLLLNYAKANNIEGMKYELARLYYMNYILERRLYHNKSLPNKEKNIRTRARVLNDFNKYIKYLLEKEPNFNFAEYYEKSIFYPHTVEVKSGTILKLKDIINYIL